MGILKTILTALFDSIIKPIQDWWRDWRTKQAGRTEEREEQQREILEQTERAHDIREDTGRASDDDIDDWLRDKHGKDR